MSVVERVVSRGEMDNNLVLVVDDNPVNRMLLGQMITNVGLEVAYAEDGIGAIQQYEELRPSLILMDVNMPELNGIDATLQIKSLAGERFIPIILVSGAEEHDVIRAAIDAGGDDFIQRPFPLELLEGKIVALRRIAELYQQVSRLNQIRASEAEVAEQLLSGAVESDNVALDQIRIHKQPAATFSGDVQLTAYRPNGDLNVLLGDFTGHGLTSALGALPLSETFRAMTAKGYDAEDILIQINRKLNRLLPTGLFLAAAIVTLNADGSVRIWNGGLPDVMVFRRGQLVKRISSSHPPLGILPQLKELQFELYTLAPEDHLLLISDGVLEAHNRLDEMFGEERLLRAISKGAVQPQGSLVDSVLVQLDEFMAGQPPKDDISLIDIPGGLVNAVHQPAVAARVVDEEPAIHDVWNWSLELQGQSLARINPVAQALGRLQESEGAGDKWNSVFSVLTELYVNALDHGVLRLESCLKQSASGFAEYFAERDRRLESLTAGSVALYLQHIRLPQGGRLQVRIEDSGAGFDYQYWLKKADTSHTDQLCGRGIRLVTELCESINYTNNGASVEVVCVYSTADSV